MEHANLRILADNYNEYPLSYEDMYRRRDDSVGKIGDGHFSENFYIGDKKMSTAVRVEYVANEQGIEPVLHVGLADFQPNMVHVKSAEMPIFDFLALADAVVANDKVAGIACVHRILQYEAPDIIDQTRETTAVGLTKQFLEYGLLNSDLWAKASQGKVVSLVNPNVSTLKRVLHVQGEKSVYFTETTRAGDEYFAEITKAMADDGYNRSPIRIPLKQLPPDRAYYLGFSGGIENASRRYIPHMFGFELNPYHPDSLNGMMSGVMITDLGIRFELNRGSYTRYEIYEDEPTYFRYYGDVVKAAIGNERVGGDEAFNFVCSVEVQKFQRTDTTLNEGDVLCDGYFFKEPISRKESRNGSLYYLNDQNEVIDKEMSCSFENRLLVLKEENDRKVIPWKLASVVRDSRRAKMAYLRYRTSPCNIAYVRPNEPKADHVTVSLSRETIHWGQSKGNMFLRTNRDDATHVWSKKYGYRKLIEGMYPCDATEFVELLDHSMMRAEVVNTNEGIEAIIRDGTGFKNPVSKFSGRWRQLEYCRIDIDFKSNFNLVKYFKAYKKFVGPYYKRSLILAKGQMKHVENEIATQSFGDIDEGYAYGEDFESFELGIEV